MFMSISSFNTNMSGFYSLRMVKDCKTWRKNIENGTVRRLIICSRQFAENSFCSILKQKDSSRKQINLLSPIFGSLKYFNSQSSVPKKAPSQVSSKFGMFESKSHNTKYFSIINAYFQPQQEFWADPPLVYSKTCFNIKKCFEKLT